MAIQNDNTVLNKGDLKAYHEKILPYLGGNMMMQTGVNDYYSTDEKVVGVWIDGKPLYQKTVNFGTLPNNAKKAVAHGISNIEKVISIDGSAYGTTGGVFYAFTFPNVGTNNQYTYDIAIDITGANIDITTQTDRTFLTGIVTIKYTKTTDTTTTALTTPGCYDSNRPDLWPANKEVFFGNGLYGFRAIGNFTANISAGSNVWTQIADINLGLSKAPKTYSSGGWFTFVSNGTRSYQAVNQARAGNMNSSTYFATAGTLRFQAISYTNSTMAIVSGTDNYDIWVIYTK